MRVSHRLHEAYRHCGCILPLTLGVLSGTACGGTQADISQATFSEGREGAGSDADPAAVGTGEETPPESNASELEESTGSPIEPRCNASATAVGDFELASQEQVDALANCETVQGDLHIIGPGSASQPLDLSPLAQLHTVTGTLSLEMLASLDALAGLRSVESLSLESISGALSPLAGLSGEL